MPARVKKSRARPPGKAAGRASNLRSRRQPWRAADREPLRLLTLDLVVPAGLQAALLTPALDYDAEIVGWAASEAGTPPVMDWRATVTYEQGDQVTVVAGAAPGLGTTIFGAGPFAPQSKIATFIEPLPLARGVRYNFTVLDGLAGAGCNVTICLAVRDARR